MVDVSDSNRRPTKSSFAALTSELPSSRNTFSRPRAYATAAPRAPDGHRNPYRWKPFDRCFALALRKRQYVAWPHPPAARARHQGTAHRAPHSEHPCPRAPCPDAKGADAVTLKMLKVRTWICGPLRSDSRDSTPLRTRKRKRPRFDPRAFAFLGDRGDRSPKPEISRIRAARRAAVAARHGLRRGFLATCRVRLRWGARTSWVS